ncbi:MAG TPA: dTDP-4-dehydrorhamnose 3,5-epimerase [bacterium]|nr:dTDP-4-dehydrorhamnose 3,5-epimerase [bacterium]
MRLTPTRIKDVLLVEPDVYKDNRGFFLESYHFRKFSEAGLKIPFVQDNHSRSAKGTVRGLHAQLKKPQGKLVRVVQGEIFDVVVDARPDSSTFGQWVGEILSEENFRQLYTPPGFLHGFCVTTDFAEVEYKCTDFYDVSDEVGVRWNDPDLKIAWTISNPVLSEKDKKLPLFREAKAKFDFYRADRLAK